MVNSNNSLLTEPNHVRFLDFTSIMCRKWRKKWQHYQLITINLSTRYFNLIPWVHNRLGRVSKFTISYKNEPVQYFQICLYFHIANCGKVLVASLMVTNWHPCSASLSALKPKLEERTSSNEILRTWWQYQWHVQNLTYYVLLLMTLSWMFNTLTCTHL